MLKIDSLELLSCYIMDIVHVIKCSLKMGFFFSCYINISEFSYPLPYGWLF